MKNLIAYQLTYEEMLFLNKNKEYGAFTLRKAYSKNLSIALILSAFLFTGAISYSLLLKDRLESVSLSKGTIVDQLSNPPSINAPNPVPISEPQVPLKSTIKFLPPVVKPDEKVNDLEIIPDLDALKGKVISTVTKEGDNKNGVEIITDIPEPIKEIDNKVSKDETFRWVEEMPRYRGGDEELYGFFSKNLKYPEIAIKAGIEGRVLLSFIVEKSGQVTGIEIIKGIGGGCDEEAARVVRLMDNWSPGRQNGNSVRVRISIPVVFKLH